MLCGLCLEECRKYYNLYDSNYQQNEIYETILLYFPEELEKQNASITNCSNVVCLNCWSIIKAYDELRQRISVAQLNIKNVKNAETYIKLEEVDIEFANFADTDNLAISEPQIDVFYDKNDNLEASLEDLKLISEDNFAKSENDDEDPSYKNSISGICSDDDKFESDANDDDDEDNVPLSKIIKNKNFLKKVSTAKKSKKGRSKLSINLKKKKDTNSKGESLQHIKSAESDKFIADWKDTLPCDICDYSAENFTVLRRHFKDLHASTTPYVKCCGKKYIKRIRLVEHIRKHLDPESFKCPECGKCSANSDCLNKHIKTAHGPDSHEKKFKCDVCQKAFAQQSVLKRHMDVHVTGQKDHICPHCEKGFVLEKRLQIHIKNIHCATCVCELCGRSFRNPYALKDHHMLEHEGIQKPKWPCDQCSAQLKSKYNLAYHKRTVHNDGSTLYECSECGKVALSEGALLRHKRNVHAAPRKFKCTICEKAFKVAQVLKEHMTIHTGEELYTCPHCPKTFRVNANMHHHRKRVHPKEWAEKRSERPFIPNTDVSQVSQKVVI